ncbi:MAG TPA: hypothetical protein VGJ86_08815 [Acidimicrobiales bacterium]|jgi:hypothetical protein
MLHLPLSDREVERVLAGQQPYGRPDLAELAFFVARLRALGEFEPVPAIDADLRAQMEGEPADRRRLPSGRAKHSARPTPQETRRVAERARRRWRIVGAAAVFALLGGAVAAGWQTGGEPGVETDTQVDSGNTGSTDGPVPAPKANLPGHTGETKPPPTEAPTVPPTEAPAADSNSQGGDSEAQTTPGVGPPQVAPNEGWFDWPEECASGDWVCAWQHWVPQGDHDESRGNRSPDRP